MISHCKTNHPQILWLETHLILFAHFSTTCSEPDQHSLLLNQQVEGGTGAELAHTYGQLTGAGHWLGAHLTLSAWGLRFSWSLSFLVFLHEASGVANLDFFLA